MKVGRDIRLTRSKTKIKSFNPGSYYPRTFIISTLECGHTVKRVLTPRLNHKKAYCNNCKKRGVKVKSEKTLRE